MSSAKPNNAIVVDKSTQRLNALKAYVKNPKTEIAINGVTHKLNDVIAIYQTSLDTRAALATKRSEVKAAMGARAEAEDARREADRTLKYWVINQFGVGSQQAIDFGFPPPKTVTRTVESKTHAVLQGKATRVARNTMGSRQKEQIKGVIGTPSAPAAPTTNVQATAPAAPVAPVQTAAPVASISSPVLVTHVATPPASVTAPVMSGSAPVVNGAAPAVNGITPVTNGVTPQSNGMVS